MWTKPFNKSGVMYLLNYAVYTQLCVMITSGCCNFIPFKLFKIKSVSVSCSDTFLTVPVINTNFVYELTFLGRVIKEMKTEAKARHNG